MFMVNLTTRTLSCAMVVSVLCLSACDEAYDLSKDINTDIQIGKNFRIPVGRTDTIYVSRIINESESLTENNGIYEVTSSGYTETSIDPLDDVEIHDLVPEMQDASIRIPQTPDLQTETTINVGTVNTSGLYDIDEKLPEEVEELYVATFKGGNVNTNLTISIGALPAGVKSITLNNLTIEYPSFITLANGTNSHHIDQAVFDVNNISHTYSIDIKQLVIGRDEQDRYIIPNSDGCNHLIINELLKITAETSITLNGATTDSDLAIDFNYTIDNDASVNNIAGRFKTPANISSNIALNDIPNFLLNGDTQLSPQEVYMYIDLNNPADIPGSFSIDIIATNDQQSSTASTVIDMMPNQMNNILLCNFDASVDGYTTVVEPSITNLFQFVPQNIEIRTNDLELESTTNDNTLELGRGYDIRADYRAVVPFKFNNIAIEYTDSIDGLLSDLEDVADKTDRIIVRATGVTNIPTDLKPAVKLYDIYGTELTGIDVNLDNFNFKAATEGTESVNELEIVLTEREGSNDFERLEKILFTIKADATGNIILRPRQYLLIKDIFVEIPDGISMTF